MKTHSRICLSILLVVVLTRVKMGRFLQPGMLTMLICDYTRAEVTLR